MGRRLATGLAALLALAVAGSPIAASEAAPLRDPTILTRGAERPLGVFDAVYRPRAREYAVIVSSYRPGSPNQAYAVWRVGRDGRPLAPARDVSPPDPPKGYLSFDMEYDPKRDEFLQIYSADSGPPTFAPGPALTGQRLSGSGAPIGGPFAVTEPAPAGRGPYGANLTYVPATGGYLLTWTIRLVREPDQPDRYRARAQALDAFGRASGGPVRPVPGSVYYGYRVHYDPHARALLATWHTPEWRRRQMARRLTTSGRPSGPVRDLGSARRRPISGLEFVPTHGAFVAARASKGSVFAQRLDGTGQPRGRRTLVIRPTESPRDLYGAQIDYASRNDQLLLTWSEVEDRYDRFDDYAFVRRFDASGRRARGPARAVEAATEEGLTEVGDVPVSVYSPRWNEFLIALSVHEFVAEDDPRTGESGIAVHTLRMPARKR